MSMHAELLSPPVNFAVVQLPERKFPGVVCQGDTLFYLVSELTEFVRLLETGRLGDEQLEDIAIGLKSMRDQLGAVLTHYEAVCNDREITLPYEGISTVRPSGGK